VAPMLSGRAATCPRARRRVLVTYRDERRETAARMP
jgi:hypothetical protein